MFRVAVLASGHGSNLRSLLRHIDAGHVAAKVVLVVADRPAGALDIARDAKVPALAMVPPGPDHDGQLAKLLLDAKPDLVVLAGYLRIVGPEVLGAFPQRVVNIHPSLLPSFRGLHAVRQALRAGARIAGCTTHIVTSELDGGPLLLQAALAVREETEEQLARRILALEHLLLPRTVALFAEGRVAVEGGRAMVHPGASWLDRPGIALVAGALYGEGF